MLAFVLSSLIAAAGEPAYLASCPAAQTRIIATSGVVEPLTIHATNRKVKFMVDIGSDGEIRHATMTESSGDNAYDAAALDAVKRYRFAPPTQGCISTSTVVPVEFTVPLIGLVQPGTNAAGNPILATAAPAAAVAICGAPGVQLTGLDVPDSRQAPGTVDIDVGLDAAAHVTSAKLARASGNAKTDAAGLSAARTAQYAFTLTPGCRPSPTTYRLELTYR